jgi:hypothetical protein
VDVSAPPESTEPESTGPESTGVDESACDASAPLVLVSAAVAASPSDSGDGLELVLEQPDAAIEAPIPTTTITWKSFCVAVGISIALEISSQANRARGADGDDALRFRLATGILPMCRITPGDDR